MSPLVALSVMFAACSSTGAPGAGEVLGQVDKAKLAQVEVALTTAAQGEEAHFATQGNYTTNVNALGMSPSGEVNLTVVRADASGFCVEATHGELEGSWHITNSSSTAEGPC
jgi:hypothetical protein